MSDEARDPQDTDEVDKIREITYKKTATREEGQATQVSRTGLQSVEAETVMLDRSSSESINANRVVMERSAARSIEAGSAQLDDSAVASLGSDHAVLLRSKAMQVAAEELRMNRSRALIVSARNAEIENSQIAFFAGSASGEVRALFTPVTAAIAGAGFGVALVLLGGLLKATFGRD